MTTITQATAQRWDYQTRQYIPYTIYVGDLVLCTRTGYFKIEGFVERAYGRGENARVETETILRQVVNKHGKKVKRAKVFNHSSHGIVRIDSDYIIQMHAREVGDANEKLANLLEFVNA